MNVYTVQRATPHTTESGVFDSYEAVVISVVEGQPYMIPQCDNTMLCLGSGNKFYYPNATMIIGSCRAWCQGCRNPLSG